MRKRIPRRIPTFTAEQEEKLREDVERRMNLMKFTSETQCLAAEICGVSDIEHVSRPDLYRQLVNTHRKLLWAEEQRKRTLAFLRLDIRDKTIP